LGAAIVNCLYKYCDQVGAQEVLKTLELKLPYVAQVNDPLECFPEFRCPNDEAAIDASCVSVFKRRGIALPPDYRRKLSDQVRSGELQEALLASHREVHEEWNRSKTCLLSVSEDAQEFTMWAHYADGHRGAVIGIDFDSVLINGGIKMDRVTYSKHRPVFNVLEESAEYRERAMLDAIMTKSDSWAYEKEARSVFLVDALEMLQQQGGACLRDFRGGKAWFLKLNPVSVRSVVFGLSTPDSVKSAIRCAIDRPELRHVELYQAEVAGTYALNLGRL
jgi:hypothetical protein